MKKLLIFALAVLFVISAFSFKAIMVTDTGGLGDKSFNDGTWSGIQRAGKELGIETMVIQSYEQADYVSNLTKAAQEVQKEPDGGIVYAVGFMMTDALFEVAQQFPDVYFAGIDIAPPSENVPPNVICFLFKEQESAFLVGYIAAATTRAGKVGFIGGIPIPPVERFRYGFETGVKVYNNIHGTNVEILKGYTNHFSDPKKGKDLALSQFAEGVDIIFHASGACGNGVIEAAKEKMVSLVGKNDLVSILDYAYNNGGYFAMGVDVDQDYMAPGVVLASAMKGVDTASYYGVKWAYEGNWDPGIHTLGLKENGVRMSPMKYTKGLVDNRTLAELAYLVTLIKNGILVVPDTEEALKSFRTPKIVFPF
ncbi:membrane protein [Thermosipho melanesiensis]|uniref:Basic membrane lipoprotein n=2 Tax=Thermosipho melanesiensis TaxID=46541 RepID=A6LIZ5_THEM4|nr:BMP family ABC transporter substrate-binding protein [Thermosipho melanesiensis]ABR29896.1 basic membrane lipoprotein [Thermosipho melanesiensis BI429]APT73105.1 membrane protein [Thermosipho melanesiensis]OOC38504.1 membrane protein [Thermosipho melanesiensis]OOC40308.1 membrane protein [Thermosipho melanesiensis]OOC40572.1 membrane protein [Thermosipho melanesiensis]